VRLQIAGKAVQKTLIMIELQSLGIFCVYKGISVVVVKDPVSHWNPKEAGHFFVLLAPKRLDFHFWWKIDGWRTTRGG